MKGEYERSKQARQTKQLQWFQNMSMFYGNQYAERMRTTSPEGFRDKLTTPKKPYYHQRKTINRTRSFVRAEHAKFLASIPQAVAVPATAEDEDVRAAYAAEQAWQSISDMQKLRTHFRKAAWWTIITGNGFLKTWWDTSTIVDKETGDKGNVRFGSITPFHLFVPDLREQEIEDQPFVINAYTKSVEWCRQFFAEALNGTDIQPSSSSSNSILEEGYLNLSSGSRTPDSVVVYECWCKPGATKYLPEGGVIIVVDDKLVGMYRDGLPYAHDQYPYTKFEHIPTSTFYADSPLVDTNQLQREYNQLRSEISEAGRRMAKPQLLAQRGSIVPSKLTNEPGLVIEYKVGYSPPTPMALTPLPQYYIDQQDRILSDWEDLTGQHEVSKGQAPAGVTAGTAINYLQEKDDSFLSPQYESIEDGYERLASQSLQLFVQYVDLPRKIKTIGTDQSFDTVLLKGADIKNGTDIRIQKGTAVGQSQAAKEAKVMDMFSIGLIDQPMALKLLEVGGAQKVLDLMNVAERKAMRENTKMKMLKPEMFAQAQQLFEQQVIEAAQANPELAAQWQAEGMPEMPPMIPVDDFDVHEVHIDTHNKFRMGQEYESLSPEHKEQFELHVAEHTRLLQQAKMMQFLDMIPSDGSDGGPAAGGPELDVTTGGAEEAPVEGPGATMADNGAVPAPVMEG